MQTKLKKLINRSYILKVSAQAQISSIIEKEKLLNNKESKMKQILEELRLMIGNKRLDGNIVKRKDIYDNLRKLSVVEHNISLIELEIAQIRKSLDALSEEKDIENKKLKALWLRQKKYEYLIGRIRKIKNDLITKTDDDEQEEAYNGRN